MASGNRRNAPQQPGSYVRHRVIPKDMTVAKAAELLGIGRPALSNFLNGKASLSQDMAKRLARVFDAEIEHLLNLQAQFDRRDEALHAPVVAGRLAPTLVEIKANRIAAWADEIRARGRVAGFSAAACSHDRDRTFPRKLPCVRPCPDTGSGRRDGNNGSDSMDTGRSSPLGAKL